MNLLLLLPLGLAALASLLLPILLHLARRSEPEVVPFAALRWLRAAPQPQRKHRLEEWLLLLVRLLLLAALALLIAQPVLFGRPDRTPVVAVAPGIDPAAARGQVDVPEARWQGLVHGFPALDPQGWLDVDTPSSRSASLPSLLRELDSQLPEGTPLTVVVPELIEDADAQRPVLSRKVEWVVMSGAADEAVASPAGKPTERPVPHLQVRVAADRAAQARYLTAAGVAWLSTGTDSADAGDRPTDGNPVSVSAPDARLADTPRNAAWLVAGEVPDHVRKWVEAGGTLLLASDADWRGPATGTPVTWTDERGALLRQSRIGRGRVLQLTRPLEPRAMPLLLDPRFPGELREQFEPAPPAPTRVSARDYTPRTGAPAWPEQPRPLSPWLLWLVAGLFLVERWLASGRRRGTSA